MLGSPLRLRKLPDAARLLVAAFLLALATGFVAAQVNLRLQHAALDGEPGLSTADVVAAFHGQPGRSRLTAKIDGGSMERYIPRPSDRATLTDWVTGGAQESEFGAAKATLDRLCVRCHHPGGEMSQVPFAASRAEGARYELVLPVTAPDRGMSWLALARTSHAHLFGMGMLFALAGVAFLLSEAGPRVKLIAVAAPYVALFVDIGCWWLTKLHAAFAYGVVAGGALMAAAVALLVVWPLWELATPRRGEGAG